MSPLLRLSHASPLLYLWAHHHQSHREPFQLGEILLPSSFFQRALAGVLSASAEPCSIPTQRASELEAQKELLAPPASLPAPNLPKTMHRDSNWLEQEEGK